MWVFLFFLKNSTYWLWYNITSLDIAIISAINTNIWHISLKFYFYIIDYQGKYKIIHSTYFLKYTIRLWIDFQNLHKL